MAQPNFLQTIRKPEMMLALFITILTISFLLLSTSSASVKFYFWFAHDVTAAMLVVKNKSIFLLWELNSIFMLICREKILLF